MKMKWNKRIFLFVKYLFSVLLICVSFTRTDNIMYVVTGLSEAAAVILLTELLLHINAILGYLMNSLFLLILNLQFIVLLFATEFISGVMLDNIMAADMLRGKAVLYITALLAVFVISFLPVSSLKIEKIWNFGWLSILLFAQLCIALFIGNTFFAYYRFADTLAERVETLSVGNMTEGGGADETLFILGDTAQTFEKPAILPENPNIIMIFSEGCSQCIIDDERNIMPNMRSFMERSISFSNYYNHTAATYRGLIGTLFSGYQLMNLDPNYLVSIEDILRNRGYTSTFINVEPKNATFARYLQDMRFDEVISPETESGKEGLIYDDQAYSYLAEQAERLKGAGKPFFLGIYTIGTHISFKSPGEVFGDGSSDLLNRFYYMDLQFGKFLDWFDQSDLADNTLLVFTTDHCTYSNEEYTDVFDTENRLPFVDTIPFAFYHRDIVPLQINADGRNSLDCIPTICDYLDITDGNCFLGTTMFADMGEIDNDYDTITCIGMDMVSTMGGVLALVQDQQKEILEDKLLQYFTMAKDRSHADKRIEKEYDKSGGNQQ